MQRKKKQSPVAWYPPEKKCGRASGEEGMQCTKIQNEISIRKSAPVSHGFSFPPFNHSSSLCHHFPGKITAPSIITVYFANKQR
ncbi:unnamed protein product [Sphenostylis stenocarpa]|uniref:Uncharacterized protein n=1 Tax=Sphenostylis stenocarpa TaxID=92480 RepID=A0AA86S5U5_9FABA|nr:unnamed protein product [Sphenostylis stenocarpa]